MTNKFIVSTVDCINEFASDVPQSVSLRIDTMLEQRIRKLAAYVKENDLHLTEFTSMTLTGHFVVKMKFKK
nr:hypothetical protein [Enterobacter hormaechei]